MREEWWCSGCGRFFGEASEVTMKRQERLINLSNEFKDKFTETYPAVSIATVMGSTEFDECQGRFVSRRFIEEYDRRGERIRNLITVLEIMTLAFLFVVLLYIWEVGH